VSHILVKGDVPTECASHILVKGDECCGGASPFYLILVSNPRGAAVLYDKI
jgi:hypothetical protein